MDIIQALPTPEAVLQIEPEELGGYIMDRPARVSHGGISEGESEVKRFWQVVLLIGLVGGAVSAKAQTKSVHGVRREQPCVRGEREQLWVKNYRDLNVFTVVDNQSKVDIMSRIRIGWESRRTIFERNLNCRCEKPAFECRRSPLTQWQRPINRILASV
jgi:hypothetical protein